eukprot:scaffold20034_cov72-Skeletonema_menzelii.AAC.1
MPIRYAPPALSQPFNHADRQHHKELSQPLIQSWMAELRKPPSRPLPSAGRPLAILPSPPIVSIRTHHRRLEAGSAAGDCSR